MLTHDIYNVYGPLTQDEQSNNCSIFWKYACLLMCHQTIRMWHEWKKMQMGHVCEDFAKFTSDNNQDVQTPNNWQKISVHYPVSK